MSQLLIFEEKCSLETSRMIRKYIPQIISQSALNYIQEFNHRFLNCSCAGPSSLLSHIK